MYLFRQIHRAPSALSASEEIAFRSEHAFCAWIYCDVTAPSRFSSDASALCYFVAFVSAASSHMVTVMWRQIITFLGNLCGRGRGGVRAAEKPYRASRLSRGKPHSCRPRWGVGNLFTRLTKRFSKGTPRLALGPRLGQTRHAPRLWQPRSPRRGPGDTRALTHLPCSR